MRIIVNGDPSEVTGETTVAAVVAQRSQDGKGIAVALNGEVVPRAGWNDTLLSENDKVEVLAARGGG